MEITVEQPGGPFYSVVGDLGSAAWATDLTIQMVRGLGEDGREKFWLLRRIGYVDAEVGQIVVPKDLDWTTDLTSVPWFMTWLVPKTGTHLPAAILHDGLVMAKGEPASYYSPGHTIHRDQADRIFRDAMIATGTPTIRAWLVWAAVTAATIFHGRSGQQVDWRPLLRWYYFSALCVTAGLIVVLGLWSALDVFGVQTLGAGENAVRVPDVPWISDGPWLGFLGGFAGSVVIPLALGTLWGKFRAAGWILGPIAAILLLAVVPILFLGGLYVAAETLYRSHRVLARSGAVAGVGLSCVLFVLALAGW